jgi:hypothetical protein
MAESGHNGKGRTTPDVTHVRNVDVEHELSDINVGAVLTFVGALTAMTILVYLAMFLLFRYYDTKTDTEPQPGPMARSALPEKDRQPPGPVLQNAPGFSVSLENGEVINLEKRKPDAEYLELRKQWEEDLKDGARDQSGKVVGMPIDQAIKSLASGNTLPSRQSGAPQKLDDLVIRIPTFASSGRTTEEIR